MAKKKTTKKAESEREALPFEEELARLEEMVDHLERGDLSLEKAIVTFKEGFQSYRHCQKVIEEAREQIETLCKEAGWEGDGTEDSWKPAEFGDLGDA